MNLISNIEISLINIVENFKELKEIQFNNQLDNNILKSKQNNEDVLLNTIKSSQSQILNLKNSKIGKFSFNDKKSQINQLEEKYVDQNYELSKNSKSSYKSNTIGLNNEYTSKNSNKNQTNNNSHQDSDYKQYKVIDVDIINDYDILIDKMQDENNMFTFVDMQNENENENLVLSIKSKEIEGSRKSSQQDGSKKSTLNQGKKFHTAKRISNGEKIINQKQETNNSSKKDEFLSTKEKLSRHSSMRDKNQLGLKKKITYRSQIIDTICKEDSDSLDYLKQEINMATIGAILVDINDMSILQTNNEFNDHLFYDRIELIGNEISTIMPPMEKDNLSKKINNLIDSDSISSETFDIIFYDKNHVLVTTEATLTLKKISNIEMILIQSNTPIPEDNFIIPPSCSPYIGWVALITAFLLFITIQMPQDIIFNQSRLTDQTEIPVTIIFAVDIILNFNLAIDQDDKLCYDRLTIAVCQLKGWFQLDFISTVPISMLMESFENTGWLRSLKILRIFRFIKLLRLIKLSYATNYQVIKDEFTKSLQKIFKQNQGQFDLLKNMFYIYLFAHYQTIFFFQIEDSVICKYQISCWLNQYRNTISSDEISAQNQILYQNIKIALGLDNMGVNSNIETYLAIIWMFIGLSLFGQGIGNISAYLSQTNKEELEHIQTYTFFNELCFMFNIDSRLQSKVLEYIDNQYGKYLDRELMHYQFALPPQLFEQIEINMQTTFVKQFPLFEKLNTVTLRKIKHNCTQENKKNVTRRGISIKDIYFILDGSINIQDENMNIVSYYDKNEIQGLSEFYEQFLQKYKVDIQNIFAMHNAEVDCKVKEQLKNKISNVFEPNNSIKSLKDLKDKNESVIRKRSSLTSMSRKKTVSQSNRYSILDEIQKNNKDDNINLLNKFTKEFRLSQTEFKMTQSEPDEQLVSNMSAISSDEINLISIPQMIFEEIFFEDVDSFQQIQKQFYHQNRDILDEEWNESDKILEKFMENNNSCIIITLDGQIFDVNESFSKYFDVGKKLMQEMNITDIIQLRDSNNRLSQVFDIGLNKNQWINLNSNQQKCVIDNSGPCKIVKQDRKSNLKNHQLTLAKNLMQVYVLEFQINFEDYK